MVGVMVQSGQELMKELTTYQNPVVNTNFADPGVLALPDGSGFVVVSTGTPGGNAFKIMTSADLVHWKEVNH